jgi:CHASE3 domain sensor protein
LELDETLQQRLTAFSGAEGPRLPSGESPEGLLKKVEDLRQVILNQEERAQIYADLIVLQNEKLSAMDEEVDALKKLIQIDYQEAAAKKKTQDSQQP